MALDRSGKRKIKMLVLWNFAVLYLSLIIGINGSDLRNIQLQVCTQKEEGMQESIPLRQKKVEAIDWFQKNTDREISIDVCASEHVIKMSLLLYTGLKGDVTLCMRALSGTSDYKTCYNVSIQTTVKSIITCWFRQNVTERIIVMFYVSLHTESQHSTYSGSDQVHNKGLCEPSICEKVEPLYADKLYCGHKAQMEIPSNGTVWFITMSCSYCGDPEEEDMLFSTNDTNSTTVTFAFGGDHDGKYNITVWLIMKDEFGNEEFCGYVKTVTIFCIGGSLKVHSTRETRMADVRQSNSSNNNTCDTNFSQCSFLNFVLFGVTVSAVIIVVICFVTFIFVKRKKIARFLRSICSGNSETVSTGSEHIPMVLNNHTRRESPVLTHFPKHAHFHKTDELYRLLFLPRPYDPFTRDCMDRLRKILSLDGRIPSSCVFDKSIQNEIFSNKFQWIDKVLGDRHNIVIFLCFTSPSVIHEDSIVEDVMKRCQPPATPPTCRTFFSHMTDSTQNLEDISFSGKSFTLTYEKQFERFLEAVFIIYGYKADNEHDKQKFKQILHCGVSRDFLRKLNANCEHHF